MGAWRSDDTDAGNGVQWGELLPRWDELSNEALATLARDPLHGPELRLLQRVETWMQRQCAPATPCPSAEELYDYGRGPGSFALSDERRAAIATHVLECGACEEAAGTLATSPPLPLDLRHHAPEVAEEAELEEVPLPLPEPARESAAPRVRAAAPTPSFEVAAPPSRTLPGAPLLTHPRWQRNLLRVAPVAAAASLLALALLVSRDSPVAATGSLVPSAPLLRGEAGGPLLFPRGRVLAQGHFNARPTFELAEVAGASDYRVVLRRHDGSAFSEGEEVLSLDAPTPFLEGRASLSPGHYTWEAWATVGGLDRSLGSRDFSVIEDAGLLAEVQGASGTVRVRALHDAGFPTDARQLARSLPESEFREQYLRLLPGR